MECIFYTLLTLVWWALSLTILLPLMIALKLCKPFQDFWFSWFYIKFSGGECSPGLQRSRKQAFDLLKKHLKSRKTDAPLEVLEIGIGSGSTLQFYPENTNLTCLEPNESMLKNFQKNKEKYPHINYRKTVIGKAEDMRGIDDESFDVVVGSYVLCSVNSVPTVLKEIKRVLKPGGKYMFLEHIVYPGYGWYAILQKVANPVWETCYNGCAINRDHDEAMNEAKFSDVESEKFYPKDLWMYVRPHGLGIATK